MTDEAELRELVKLVESLRPPDRLTTGLDLDDSEIVRVEAAVTGVEREIWLSLPERLQRLLGFQKVNFLYGSIDYMDSLEYFKTRGR